MKLAVQLYSLRDQVTDGASLLKLLEDVKELGFEGVEFAGYFGLDAKTIRAKLDELGLVAVGTHLGLQDFAPETIDKTLEDSKILGLTYAGMGGAPHRTPDELKDTCEKLSFAVPYAAKKGITVYYHNHDEEFTLNEAGELPIAKLASVSALELDTYWSFYAGQDNAVLMQTYKDKIKLVHIKDGVDGDPCALGEGQNDLETVISSAKEIGLEWLILENDKPTPNGYEDCKRSMAYLKAHV